jgi:hypothetical protein
VRKGENRGHGIGGFLHPIFKGLLIELAQFVSLLDPIADPLLGKVLPGVEKSRCLLTKLRAMLYAAMQEG